MLHIQGHTPEADAAVVASCRPVAVTSACIRAAWHELCGNYWLRDGRVSLKRKVHLVAIGSPHASLSEVRKIADLIVIDARATR